MIKINFFNKIDDSLLQHFQINPSVKRHWMSTFLTAHHTEVFVMNISKITTFNEDEWTLTSHTQANLDLKSQNR